MAEKSRTSNSIKNTIYALSAQAVLSLTTFITRTVLIHNLGESYMGLSSLFYDILSLLSLTELGVGTAITFSMYKPMASRDYKRVTAILNFYKRVYISIGLIMTVIGLSLTPFIHYLITDIPDLPHLTLIYWLYLFNTSGSYFFSYKKSILVAEQNDSAASATQIITSVIQCIGQVVLLVTIKDFVAYLTVQFLSTMLMNILISVYVDKKYCYIKKYKTEKLDKPAKIAIWKNVGSMFISKVSSVVVTSTDNLLISTFVSTVSLGYYSNYTLFVNLVRRIFTKIFDAITGSVGNLVALEKEDVVYNKFKAIWFADFWLIGFVSATMVACINQLIICWLGEEYLISNALIILMIVNMYMRFMRNTCLIYIDAFGLFKEVRIKCVMESIINIFVSILFVGPLKMGIFGILAGTFFSNLVTNFWYEPYVVYRRMSAPIKEYFTSFLKYTMIFSLASIVCVIICNSFYIANIYIKLIANVLICVVIVNVVFWFFLHNSKEYNYFESLIRKFFIHNH